MIASTATWHGWHGVDNIWSCSFLSWPASRSGFFVPQRGQLLSTQVVRAFSAAKQNLHCGSIFSEREATAANAKGDNSAHLGVIYRPVPEEANMRPALVELL